MIRERLILLVTALIVDAALGDPDFVWRSIGHPVSWIGRLIDWLDGRLNREGDAAPSRRSAGVLAVVILLAVSTGTGAVLAWLFAIIPFGWIGTILVASIFFAGRGLFDHVTAVRVAFPDLNLARRAVARIVGRDPESLDGPAVCRAAVETTAESFSDGIVAPALWFVLFGLPGLIAYKAINTADSMVGHLNPRYAAFGWAAARLDDLANWPAARLAGALLAFAAPLGGTNIGVAFGTMLRDSGKHRSPNAGWPEAAMAGALGLALGGPRRYDGAWTDDPFLNVKGRNEATPADITRALRVLIGAWLALLALADLLSVLLSLG